MAWNIERFQASRPKGRRHYHTLLLTPATSERSARDDSPAQPERPARAREFPGPGMGTGNGLRRTGAEAARPWRGAAPAPVPPSAERFP